MSRTVETPSRNVVNIRKGDQVRVMTGRDKGKQGRVLSVDAVNRKVTVEHANIIKRHTRPNPSKNIKGGIVEREGPMAISNVLIVCPGCGKASRVGHKTETLSVTVRRPDGTEAEHLKRRLVGRICRRCGATI